MLPMRLELSPLAQADLEAIADYIAQDSPGNALHFVQALREQCNKISKAPTAYTARPELGEGLRSCAYGRYVIFFRPSGTVVRVERILHGAMDIDTKLLP